MPVETIDGVLLLGWMERDDAVRFLCKETISEGPLTEVEAEETWARYRRAVENLPERERRMPSRLEFSKHELNASRIFKNRHRTNSKVLDVVKVDPYELIVHQLVIVSGIASQYEKAVAGKNWVKECLLAERTSQVVQRIDQEGYHVDLPHGEFFVEVQPHAVFMLREFARFVSVAEFEGRMLLTAGYHRSFAYTRTAGNAPDAMARSITVALTTDLPAQLAPASPNTGLRAALAGTRPPFFGDFFDVGLAMSVKLRKKRYEILVQRNRHRELIILPSAY